MSSTPDNDFRKLMRAYAGFQMATALFVATKAGDVCWAGIVVSLFAVSIPSTVAYGGLHRITPKYEKRNPAGVAAICGVLAFIPSIAALSILLASVSTFAAFAFPITCIAWTSVIVCIRKDEPNPPKS